MDPRGPRPQGSFAFELTPCPVLLLALETAADVCGVALLRDGALVFEASLSVPRQHATRLLPLVSAGLEAVRARPEDLGAVAVSAGPGSYTGLRIGLSAAQGLCVAADAPLLQVPTLEALAEAASPYAQGSWVAAALPSRRGEVYLGVYRDGEILREPESLALAAAEQRVPDGAGVLVGPSAQQVLDGLPDRPIRLLSHVSLSAAAVGHLGWERWQAGETTDPAAATPDYLRASVATPPPART